MTLVDSTPDVYQETERPVSVQMDSNGGSSALEARALVTRSFKLGTRLPEAATDLCPDSTPYADVCRGQELRSTKKTLKSTARRERPWVAEM